MSEEFTKLDELIKRNAPALKTMPMMEIQHSYRGNKIWLTGVLSGFLLLLVYVSVLNNENQKTNHLVELSEVLMWDVTSDEMSESYEQTVALFED